MNLRSQSETVESYEPERGRQTASAMFRILREDKNAPEASTLASSLNSTAFTRLEWPLNRLMTAPEVTSQRKTDLSPPHEPKRELSGELSTPKTQRTSPV
jgi:hypothetical protein